MPGGLPHNPSHAPAAPPCTLERLHTHDVELALRLPRLA